MTYYPVKIVPVKLIRSFLSIGPRQLFCSCKHKDKVSLTKHSVTEFIAFFLALSLISHSSEP
jgi:hypothetical protein